MTAFVSVLINIGYIQCVMATVCYSGFGGTEDDRYNYIEPHLWLLFKFAPDKMKIMVWRLLHNHVPTRKNLYNRHLLADVACYSCGLEAETVIHICRDCPFVISVWEQMGLH